MHWGLTPAGWLSVIRHKKKKKARRAPVDARSQTFRSIKVADS